MEFKQILNILATGDGEAPERAVDFCHVRGKPLAVQFILARAVKFCDLARLTKLLHPSTDGLQWNVGQFFFVQRVVELTVQAPTVAHQAEQFLSVGWNRCFVSVIGAELFT